MKLRDTVLFVILWASCIIAFFVADVRLMQIIAACMGIVVSCTWFATDAICSAIRESKG